MSKFKIGDVIWIAGASQRQVRVVCPECLGTGRLRVIMGDDTEHSIECVCCAEGYNGSPGSIVIWEFGSTTRCEVISGVEENLQEGVLLTKYRYNCASIDENKCFATREEAEYRSLELVAEHEEWELRRLGFKQRQDKKWAWNVSYHRREIRELEKKILYHESKLNAVPKKFKEVDKAAAAAESLG